jgi:nucleoside phosphorylase
MRYIKVMDARQQPRILIASALKPELLPIQMAVQKALPAYADRINYLVTGCGLQAAQQSLADYLSKTPIAQVINCGTAGAIKPEVHLFEIVSPNSILSEIDKHLVTLKPNRNRQFDRFAKQQGWFVGSLCSSAVPITSSAQKERLRRQAIDIVDMEAFALLQVCRQYQLPFYCLKVVTDYAQENSETEFQQNLATALLGLRAAVIELLKFILKIG